MYPGCSPPCPQHFWFLRVPQYASFWQVLVAMDLAVLVMLLEVSELTCSCPLKHSCMAVVLWVSHTNGTSETGVLHWELGSSSDGPLVPPFS